MMVKTSRRSGREAQKENVTLRIREGGSSHEKKKLKGKCPVSVELGAPKKKRIVRECLKS